MGKKKYVKPEIREESYLLTVRAWITAVTNTSVTTHEVVSNATVQLQERLTTTSVAAQERLASAIARA